MSNLLLDLPVFEATAPDNVVRLASFLPQRQPQLNDRELVLLRSMMADHATQTALLIETRAKLEKVCLGCPIARRALLEP